MLDAMKQLGESVRGVVVIDKATSPAELASMYASGVRGVRVNLETWSHNDPVVAREKLAYAVESAGRLGWHVQIYASRGDRKSTRLNSSHYCATRMPTSA